MSSWLSHGAVPGGLLSASVPRFLPAGRSSDRALAHPFSVLGLYSDPTFPQGPLQNAQCHTKTQSLRLPCGPSARQPPSGRGQVSGDRPRQGTSGGKDPPTAAGPSRPLPLTVSPGRGSWPSCLDVGVSVRLTSLPAAGVPRVRTTVSPAVPVHGHLGHGLAAGSSLPVTGLLPWAPLTV